jgi:hypothetical protein
VADYNFMTDQIMKIGYTYNVKSKNIYEINNKKKQNSCTSFIISKVNKKTATDDILKEDISAKSSKNTSNTDGSNCISIVKANSENLFKNRVIEGKNNI